MGPFKKPYQQELFQLLLLGTPIGEAAHRVGVSKPTARKFRDDWAEDLRKAQSETADGVLDSLKKLLPVVVERLQWWAERPDLKPGPDGSYPAPVVLPPGITPRTHGEDMRTALVIRDIYDTMRDVEMEKRMAAMEKRLAELTKPPEKGDGKGE